jgi:ParB-like chromosome segregation protein Spo0J
VRYELISGHRRLACASAIGLREVPCVIRRIGSESALRRAVLDYNRQRRKTFSQLMREADALEELWSAEARSRRLGNLRNAKGTLDPSGRPATNLANHADCRNSDDRADHAEPTYPASEWQDLSEAEVGEPDASKGRGRGRTDEAIARQIGLGGKDLYRQARAIWQAAREGDTRAQGGVSQIDAGTRTIHAAYKDLRRRDRFASGFRPTPYDVWAFRHDRAFGLPHPGSIPAAIVAHTLHYFSPPGGLVVDPMAGGGVTVDVCEGMGRRCLAYDLSPTRPEIRRHDIRTGFPIDATGCDLIFCDPPYHTMLASRYPVGSVASAPLADWMEFLRELAASAFEVLRPGGRLALLLAPQTEKDIPPGLGYLDHTLFGYLAAVRAGFVPERRISCPMDGAYLPQHVRRARQEGRLLGQVRDLLVVRKPTPGEPTAAASFPFMQDFDTIPHSG